MTNSKDNPEKQESKSECSQKEQTETSQKPEKRKGRLRFKEEDMIKIKYNF